MHLIWVAQYACFCHVTFKSNARKGYKKKSVPVCFLQDVQEQDPLQKLLESRGVLLTATTYQDRSLNDVPASRNSASAISNIEEVIRKAVAIVQHNLQKI